MKIVVGFAPGGGQDILARIIAGWLTERLGQQFIIENQARPVRQPWRGNRGALGARRLHAVPVGPNNAINATFYSNLSFDITKDLQHVASLATMPNVMAVHPSMPAKTVAEFIAYAKANPGKINYASGGLGTSVHVSGELFRQMTGVQMQHVTYRGAGPATIALLAGDQVHVMFDNLNSQINHIKEGRLRALGVTSAKRSPVPAGRADRGRHGARLRGERLLRRQRAAQHSRRRSRQAQRRDQRRLARSRRQEAARGFRRGTEPAVARCASPSS